eukprot:5873199-Prorocentrum_lima.AAC.1
MVNDGRSLALWSGVVNLCGVNGQAQLWCGILRQFTFQLLQPPGGVSWRSFLLSWQLRLKREWCP